MPANKRVFILVVYALLLSANRFKRTYISSKPIERLCYPIGLVLILLLSTFLGRPVGPHRRQPMSSRADFWEAMLDLPVISQRGGLPRQLPRRQLEGTNYGRTLTRLGARRNRRHAETAVAKISFTRIMAVQLSIFKCHSGPHA